MLGGIYFLILALEEKGAQWKNFIAAGLFMGLSFLSKGPVSFYALFLPFIIAYIAVYRPKLRGKGLSLVAMIVVCLIVSLWWMAFIYIFHQDMAVSVAQKESSSWIDRNVRPWYYYWQFPAEAGVWALFFVTAILYFFIYKKEKLRKEYKFAIIWFIASIVLLSVIPEKKTRYLLPILIPGAIIIAFYIFHSAKGIMSKGERILFKINAIIIAIILIGIPVALYIVFYKEGQVSTLILILSTIFSWLLSAFIFYSLFGKQGIRVMNVYSAIILCMMMVTSLCLIPVGHMFINNERHSIRMLRDNKKVEGLPFYYDKDEEMRMELVYEANKTIRPIDPSDTVFIHKHTPFVYVTSLSIDSVFANKNVIIEPIDTFDNNWRKVGHKRYNWDLVKEVAIIKEAK